MKNLGAGISDSTSLRLLRIHNSELDDSKLVILLSNMQGNKTLESLDFSHCRIGDEGSAAIAKFLSERSSVQNLDLCNNNIGAMGVKALAFVLTQEIGCGLRKLSLRLNIFGDEGAKYLFSALTRKAPALRILNISCAGLGEDSGLLLGDVLSRNKTVINMDLSNNKLGIKAGSVILREMTKNTTLQFFDLRMTGVAKEIQLQIEKLLHANRYRSKLEAKSECKEQESDDTFLP